MNFGFIENVTKKINEIYIKEKERNAVRRAFAKVVILTLAFSLIVTGNTSVFSDEMELVEFEQVIIGSYSLWLHADGRTWQNNERPGSSVNFDLRVNAMLYGEERDAKLLSVSVYDFSSGDFRTINRLSAQDQNYAVNNLEPISFKKTLRGDFEIKTRINLTTDMVNGMSQADMEKNGFGGRNEKREWQLSEVRGYYYFVPVKLKFQCYRNVETPIEVENPDPEEPVIEIPKEVEEPNIPDEPEKPQIRYDFELTGPDKTFINNRERFEIYTTLPRAKVAYTTDPSKNVTGDILYSGGYLSFSKEGVYTVTANLLGRYDDAVIEVIDPRPSAVITSERMKENVFSLLDGSSSRDNYSEYPINWESSVWKIRPLGELTLENLEVKEENIVNDGHVRVNELKKINLKSDRTGEVEVKLTVVNSIGRTHTKTRVIKIKEDKLPIASIYTEPTSIRSEIENGLSFARVNILDTSISPDNDEIGFRKYLRVYDSNNDGSFNGEFYEYYDGTEFKKIDIKYIKDIKLTDAQIAFITAVPDKKIISRVDNVGRYVYDIYVSENGNGPFINASRIQSENLRINEVINTPPSIHFKAISSKDINIVILTDENNEELSEIVDKFTVLEQEYAAKGYTAKFSVVNSEDKVVQEKNNEIEVLEKYQNQNVKAYSRYAHLNYQIGKYFHTVSTYRVPRSAYKNYYDSGFVLSGDSFVKSLSNVKEEIKILYEYEEAVDDEAPIFDKSNDVIFKKIKSNKNSSGVRYDTAKYYPSDDPGSAKEVKIYTYRYGMGNAESSKNIRYLGAVVDDNWTVTDKVIKKPEPIKSVNYSEGLKLLSEYEADRDILIFYSKNNSESYDLGFGNHFPFANTFSENYIREQIKDVEVYTAVPEDVLNLVVKDDVEQNFKVDGISLIDIAKESKNKDTGIYKDTQINEVLSSIYEKTPAIDQDQMENNNVYVIKGEEVYYKEYYSDFENDEKYSAKWKYVHDPVFESCREVSDISFENAGAIDRKITKFGKTGMYTITNTVKDNPNENEVFSNYRKTSKESESVNIIVHERPIAYFKTDVLSKGRSNSLDIYLKDEHRQSFDPDNKSKGTNSLSGVMWFYRDSYGALCDITNKYGFSPNVKDKYEVNLPNSIISEKFELGLRVIDDFGAESIIYFENPLDLLNIDFATEKEVFMGEDILISSIVSQSDKEHDLLIKLYDGSKLLEEKRLMHKDLVSKNAANVFWKNQIFKMPQFESEKNIKVEISVIENGGRSKTKYNYVYAKKLVKLEMFSVTGRWNHWKGGEDKLGNRLSVEPNRFMSYEKITIRTRITGNPDSVEIDFDQNLKKMIFTDQFGNVYRYADKVGKNIIFPLKLNKTENDIYEGSYILPITNSTKSWENNRVKNPYSMELIIEKENVRKVYNSKSEKMVPYIEITGNIHDLMYVQPLK